MKLLNQLTIKHLLMNKKRTVVTIIGITLSTALMVGIGLLVSTFLQFMIQEEIQTSGSYHAYFDYLNYEQTEQIKRYIDVNNSYSYGVVGYANISSTNSYKPYLYIVSATDEYFLHEDLLEGRYPINDSEIVIPSHLKSNGEVDLKVGDTITLEIGPRVSQGEEIYDNSISLIEVYDDNGEGQVDEVIVPKYSKTYTVVGIIDRSKAEEYSAPGYTVFTIKSPDIVYYRTYAEYENPKKSYQITEEICGKLDDNATCNVHDGLMYYYGVSRYSNINKTISSLLTIVLTLLSVGSIIVIYNSFAISTMERKKSFGLYSSLGATPKQIKYTVFFEAFLVGLIGIVLGVLGAFLGIYILVQVLNSLLAVSLGGNLVFTVNPYYLLLPILFMILVVYISAFIPAKRSGKVTAIEMIRENDEIKIPRKNVKTPKWVRKIFGMEGEIALKNMKRNKRKYRVTLLSLFISIVLFISFSTYLQYGLSITDLSTLPNYDIFVSSREKEPIEQIQANSLIDKAYSYRLSAVYYEMLDESYYQKDYFAYLNSYVYEDNMITMSAIILEDQDFKEIAEALHVSSDQVLFLNDLSYVNYQEDQRMSYHTKMFEKDLDSLNLCSRNVCQNIPITFVPEHSIFKNLPYDQFGANLFMSESLALESGLFKNLDEDSNYYLAILSDQYEKLYQEIHEEYKNDSSVTYEAPMIYYEQEKNSILALKILMYGFITLVVLTGVTSVFNTIYTSIHLRRKEFAMLRSVGLSPKGFQKMIFFESLFFGLKSLLYALPVSFVFIFLISRSMGYSFQFGEVLIPWKAIFIAIVGVFIVVILTMNYSTRKIKKENILNSLRDENI